MQTATPANGTLTLDMNEDVVFRVPLTGNVTSVVITPLNRPGQQLEIHFEQDATGSRTVTGWPSTVKLAGGALTLTTTANKVDVITLRQMSSTGDTGGLKYRETSARSMNSAL